MQSNLKPCNVLTIKMLFPLTYTIATLVIIHIIYQLCYTELVFGSFYTNTTLKFEILYFIFVENRKLSDLCKHKYVSTYTWNSFGDIYD